MSTEARFTREKRQSFCEHWDRQIAKNALAWFVQQQLKLDRARVGYVAACNSIHDLGGRVQVETMRTEYFAS